MSKSLGPSNDKGVPKGEMTLARLIQNAAARGMVSCQGHYWLGGDGEDGARGATACCAMGASMMRPQVAGVEGYVVTGNDASDDELVPVMFDCELEQYTLGAAFEQALRPVNAR